MQLQDLHIAATDDSPEVHFATTGTLAIRGRSLPENAYTFYQPLIDWVRSYCRESKKVTTLELHLDYFNSSSGRFLFELLTTIEMQAHDRTAYDVVWVADRDDELMVEKGEELKSMLELHFRIDLR